ncbi:transcriptional regulator [cyanobacterium TDX16]|nr:transcriptional regulator [cyanobacterium TDX16]
MPEISRFFGIIITMYFRDHPPPHFHARYGSQKGRFTIEDPQMLDGDISLRAQNLVIEWARQHNSELMREWDLAATQQPLFKIAPLE